METTRMKILLATVLIAAAPALAPAQASPEAKPAAAPAAKPAAKPKLAPTARKAVEENTPIDDDLAIELSDADIEMARRVHVGEIPCELGASVKVTAMKREGMF